MSALTFDISIHRPHTRPDKVKKAHVIHYPISIHRPHTRPDKISCFSPMRSSLFQFTGLIRGPTENEIADVMSFDISIHRPHTRPDECLTYLKPILAISIHRPHTRPDQYISIAWLRPFKFQFTGLIRGPTVSGGSTLQSIIDFNSQASYEARRRCKYGIYKTISISIHRPHTRPDRLHGGFSYVGTDFNSQASYEARLRGIERTAAYHQISIHRPHTRPDRTRRSPARYQQDFNSQASYEARLCGFGGILSGENFNSQASYEARQRRNLYGR